MIKDVIVKHIKRKGKGVFALRNFNKREFIFRFKKGRIVKRKDISKLSKEDRNHLNEIIDKDTYEIQKSPEKYLNHSCDPNAISIGRSLFALRSIRKDEEITVDYRISAHDKMKLRCKCGSKKCKGTIILDFFALDKKLQNKYFPYAPKFIQDNYRRRYIKTKAIFFDVDGTIIPLKVVIRTFQETCKHFKIRILSGKEILDNTIGYRLVEVIPKLIPEALPFEKEFIKYFEDHQIKNFKKYGKLLPYVKPTFKEIKKRKIRIGIVTTKKRKEAEAIFKGYNLPYDTVIGNDDVKNRKPDPEPVLKACKNLRVKPEECIFVGDTPFDVEAAKSAGCLAVGILTGWGNRKNLKDSDADYIIKDLGGLIKLIEGD